jgi:hypothetical protein
MWGELLSITMAQSHVIANYNSIPADRLLTDMFYAPELKFRLGDLNKERFLGRVETYRTYFKGFLEAFIECKPKLFDEGTGASMSLSMKETASS